MQYLTANEYFRRRFGRKVYKLALSGGMTCPNRDGAKGDRGCIFCSASGSGDFAEPLCGDVFTQIERAKARVAPKLKGAEAPAYIAYFQSFTNTYAPVDSLEALFLPAISHPDVVALGIATRPDCLPGPVLDLLDRLNRIKPVIVELGLQTIHPETAAFIRRGYPLKDYDRAVAALKALGIHTVVHMILGLTGETEEMTVATARYIGQSGADGMKLQLLHVLEGTDLAALWRRGEVPILTPEQYAHTLAACLEVLPEGMVIHRLTGDGAKKDLLAPLWSADKKRVINYIHRYLRGI